MKTNLTLEEREACPNKILCVGEPNKILCVGEPFVEGQEQLWTVYEEGDVLP